MVHGTWRVGSPVMVHEIFIIWAIFLIRQILSKVVLHMNNVGVTSIWLIRVLLSGFTTTTPARRQRARSVTWLKVHFLLTFSWSQFVLKESRGIDIWLNGGSINIRASSMCCTSDCWILLTFSWSQFVLKESRGIDIWLDGVSINIRASSMCCTSDCWIARGTDYCQFDHMFWLKVAWLPHLHEFRGHRLLHTKQTIIDIPPCM